MKNWFEAGFRIMVAIAGGLLFLAGIGLLALMVWGYLKSGYWGAPSLGDFMSNILVDASGAAPARENWVGLWNILDLVPLWLASAVAGLFVFLAAFSE
jgi:hypothetical protein